jgi:hypothetical protein
MNQESLLKLLCLFLDKQKIRIHTQDLELISLPSKSPFWPSIWRSLRESVLNLDGNLIDGGFVAARVG